MAGIAVLLLSSLPTFFISTTTLNLGKINDVFQTQQVGWVQTANFLAGAVFTIPLGKLSDAYGKKRLLVVSLVVILAGSLLCATTHSFSLLLVGRVLQGFDSCLLLQTYGLIRDLVPRRRIPVAVAVASAGFALAEPVSLIVGSKLTAHNDYRAMFWWMVGATGLALILAVLAFPESPLRTPEMPDWVGIGLAACAAFCVTYGLNEVPVPGRGWTSLWTIGFLVTGVVLGIGFYVYERNPDAERLDAGLLRSKPLRRTLAVTLLYGVLLGALEQLPGMLGQTPSHLGPLNLGYGLGWSLEQFGYRDIPPCLVAIALTFAAAWYVRRRGARLPVIASILADLAALFVMGYGGTNVTAFVVGLVLLNTATYYFLTGGTLLVMDSAEAHHQGYAVGLFLTFLNIGISIATQLQFAIFAHQPAFSDPLSGTVVPSLDAVHQVVLVTGAGGALALIAAFLIPHGRTPSIGGALADATYRTGAGREQTPATAFVLTRPGRSATRSGRPSGGGRDGGPR